MKTKETKQLREWRIMKNIFKKKKKRIFPIFFFATKILIVSIWWFVSEFYVLYRDMNDKLFSLACSVVERFIDDWKREFIN